MGGMMGSTGMGAWILLWIFIAVAVAATGGVLIVRALGTRHEDRQLQVRSDESVALREARDALRMRYAKGEISREEYLQGKVELEDDLPEGRR
jgi:uncharacterized membrane protein